MLRKGATGRPSTHNLVSSYGGLWISVAQMVRMTSPAVMDRSGTFISRTWPFHKATRKTAGVFVRCGWGGSICQRATSWVERVGFFWRYHFSRPGNSDMAHGARRRRCVVPGLLWHTRSVACCLRLLAFAWRLPASFLSAPGGLFALSHRETTAAL